MDGAGESDTVILQTSQAAPMSNQGKKKLKRNNMAQVNDNQNANINALLEEARSEVTIYKNAVDKRNNSSSEEETSDESLNNTIEGLLISGLVLGTTSKQPTVASKLTVRERTEQLIKQAEAAKAKLFPPKGKEVDIDKDQFEFVAKIDQDYLSIRSHVDQATQDKIKRGSM